MSALTQAVTQETCLKKINVYSVFGIQLSGFSVKYAQSTLHSISQGPVYKEISFVSCRFLWEEI